MRLEILRYLVELLNSPRKSTKIRGRSFRRTMMKVIYISDLQEQLTKVYDNRYGDIQEN